MLSDVRVGTWQLLLEILSWASSNMAGYDLAGEYFENVMLHDQTLSLFRLKLAVAGMPPQARQHYPSDLTTCALHWLCCRTFNIGGGAYNSFAMTRSAINRFGLFDENIYPSFYEDNDFQIRQARMQPPMQPKTLENVVMHHGKPRESSYSSGMHTPDDPTHGDVEQVIRSTWQQRFVVNGNYVSRKWGCQPGSWASCAFQTPFNKPVPVW
jgi:hypothetical protein